MLTESIKWEELRTRIIKEITPDGEELKAVEDFCDKIEEELSEYLEAKGLDAVAVVHGSTARGTWLSGERDVDVFIILNPKYGRAVLPRTINVVKEYVGEGWVEAYAQHPYIRAEIDGFEVEFVPCFRVDPVEGLISATDRTPLHTVFVKEHLTLAQRVEVRLLKRFLIGIGVYGAEVRIGGFSGYLCELLIIHIGSFETVLRAASSWRHNEVIDITGIGDHIDLRKRFKDQLIVVDPVDPSRNVASAVRATSMWIFSEAARAFLKGPEDIFFNPKESKADASELLESLNKRDSDILFVVVEDEQADVPDVLWGQLYKAERAITKFLIKRDFRVIRSATWSDETTRHTLVFELESVIIPKAMRLKGPPVEMAESSRRFLQAHLNAHSTVSGPWIEGRRWWVETRRQHTDARQMLTAALRCGGREIGIPRRLSFKMMQSCKVLFDGEVFKYLHEGLIFFLERFLKGRPGWLE